MKQKLVPIAIVGLFSAAAFADDGVTIAGKLTGGFSWKKNVDGTTVKGINDMGSEIDFSGRHDLGNGLKAIWQLNNNVHIDGSQSGDVIASGDTWVGLSGGFGAVKLGHGVNAYGDGYWNGGFYSAGDHGPDKGVGGVLGMGDAGGQKGAIKYETPKFGHVNAAVSWAAGEKSGSGSKAGNAWAVGANYEGAFYGLHVGYAHQDLVTGTPGAFLDSGSAADWVVAGKITPFDGLNLGAEFNHSTLSASGATIGSLTVPSDRGPQNSMALHAEYKPDRFAVRATYMRTNNYQYDRNKHRTEYVLGTSYDLSKRTALIAEFLNSKVNTDKRASHELQVGLRVNF